MQYILMQQLAYLKNNTMYRLLFFSSLLLFSCKQEVKEELIVEEVQPEISTDDFHYDTLAGIYQGDFAGSQIKILLRYVSSSKVIGYNIHKGLKRNLNGSVRKSNDSIYLELKEPGDHEFDGVFNLVFIGDDHQPTGMWVSNSGKLKPKKLALDKLIIPEVDDNEKLTEFTFTRFFSYLSDSVGDYQFMKDGMVHFEYYPNYDNEDRVEQLKKINGSWQYKDSIVKVDWQPNDVFPDKQSTYRVKPTDWGYYYLEGPFGPVEEMYP